LKSYFSIRIIIIFTTTNLEVYDVYRVTFKAGVTDLIYL
jgi:hypothetical protein